MNIDTYIRLNGHKEGAEEAFSAPSSSNSAPNLIE